MIIYKSLSKQELIQDANISQYILRQWLHQSADILRQFNVSPKAKVLPPAVVRLLSERYQFMPRNAVIK